MRGAVIAVGTSGQHITFTSDLDHGAGGSGTPARGDWRAIRFYTASGDSPSSALSRLRFVDLRYGGWSASCNSGGLVVATGGRPVRIEDSSLSESFSAGVSLSGTSASPSEVRVERSEFASTCNGIYTVGRDLTARHNTFASTVTGWQLYLQADHSVIEYNRFDGKIDIVERSTGLNTVRYNDVLGGLGYYAYSSTYKAKDLRWNWWGHVVATPPFCGTSTRSCTPNR